MYSLFLQPPSLACDIIEVDLEELLLKLMENVHLGMYQINPSLIFQQQTGAIAFFFRTRLTVVR